MDEPGPFRGEELVRQIGSDYQLAAGMPEIPNVYDAERKSVSEGSYETQDFGSGQATSHFGSERVVTVIDKSITFVREGLLPGFGDGSISETDVGRDIRDGLDIFVQIWLLRESW